jgi:trk system potassium uptake protein TrkA
LARENDVLVIGLGRFGGALARSLTELGYSVLGVDSDAELVQQCSQWLTHVVQADATSADAMRQLGAPEFGTAVVAIGTDIESSVLATALVVDLGIDRVWAKAITRAHGRILERVGAHRVVFPERDMGVRVAHMLIGRTIDYIQLDEGFALLERPTPRELHGQTLEGAEVRKQYGVTVVCVKPEGGAWTFATADTVVGEHDVLVVAGDTQLVERFARL